MLKVERMRERTGSEELRRVPELIGLNLLAFMMTGFAKGSETMVGVKS
jgi:hypothetical protein